jgi:hypothetical protein
MQAYEKGGHAYHATLPTDALLRFRDAMLETVAFGLDEAERRQWELGRRIRAMLADAGFPSVAAHGYEAPGVVVCYTDEPAVQNGSRFADAGIQIAAGVPLMCDEPPDFRTFRIGLFGLDKWQDVDGTVLRLERAVRTLQPAGTQAFTRGDRPMQPDRFTMVALAAATLVSPVAAQQTVRPEDTEVWQPVPPVVTPGGSTAGAAPPSDAIVLFDGTSLDEWVGSPDGGPAGWTVADGAMTVVKSAGNIETRRRFLDFQLHLEFRIPEGITGEGQARGNSGVYLAFTAEGGYELQVLDSYGNETYVNGMAGAVYKQSIPLANASRPPGEWQTWDIVWTAPRFRADATLESPARVTAFFNGVLVQHDFELRGFTVYTGRPEYHAHGDAPIMLQAHGDPSPPISFRNVWVRPLAGPPG